MVKDGRLSHLVDEALVAMDAHSCLNSCYPKRDRINASSNWSMYVSLVNDVENGVFPLKAAIIRIEDVLNKQLQRKD